MNILVINKIFSSVSIRWVASSLLIFSLLAALLHTAPQVYAETSGETTTEETEVQEEEAPTPGSYSPQNPGFPDTGSQILNHAPFYDETVTCTPNGTTTQLEGNDNTEKVLNFFMSKGLTLAQASGAVGNMMQESGVRPDIIQGGATADENYRMQNGVGYGLIQWTFTARQAPLQAKIDEMGMKITDIEPQLEYIWDELNDSYQHTLEAVRQADNPVDAAVAFHGPPVPGYEASADSPGFVRTVRGGNAQEVHDKYQGLTPSGNSSPSTLSGCSGGGGAGKVNAEGFAFPADLEKDRMIGFPCEKNDYCGHHDGTPAFDLYYKDSFDEAENKAVFAIRDGIIESKSTRNGYSHCFDWQLVGDDGWHYWYGHSHKSDKENGESVKAGEKIGEIGPTECADNTPPHLHIDRGFPKGHWGGSVGSRDKDFVPIMQKLWEEL